MSSKTKIMSWNILDDELYTYELKKLTEIIFNTSVPADIFNNFLNLSNKFIKLIRNFSFIFRFVSNCRNKEKFHGSITNKEIQTAFGH